MIAPGNATSAAMDINKKREAELLKLKQVGLAQTEPLLDDTNLPLLLLLLLFLLLLLLLLLLLHVQELDDANLHHETGLASIRQKHNSIIADLGDQIDQLNKGEEKEKGKGREWVIRRRIQGQKKQE